MSGIAGVVYFDKRPVDGLQSQKIADSISHRGPDGITCVQFEEGVTFIHCLLRTTPESLFESQPLKDNESEIIITADARIDNREDLIDNLNLDKDKQDHIPDSRLILEAYKKWGQECPDKLIGDFAFALWDPHYRQLFCARDHIGTRPFYYYSSDKYFVFASEIKAILTLPDVPRTINDNRVADYLQLLVGNNTDTFYKDIIRLEPATFLIVRKQKFLIKKYWDYNPGNTIKRKNNDEYAQEFKEIFFKAVHCRLRTISPIGCTMSGGLDSSSVACVAERLLEKKYHLHTFSYNFDKLPENELRKIDEREYQKAVLESGRYVHHSINGHEFAPLKDLSTHLESYDQPFFFPHLYLEWQALLIAQENGIRVMLNGLDGDSVISHGYEHLQHLILRGKFYQFYKNIKSLSDRENIPQKKYLNSCLFRPYFRDPLAYAYRLIRRKIQPHWKPSRILTKQFAQNVDLINRIKERSTVFYSAKRCHFHNLTNPLLTDLCEFTNNIYSHFQIEIRMPFFDRRVMEYCYGLPSDQKLQNGWTRFILRNAMKNTIPQKIVTRIGKSNLSPGFIHTFLVNHVRRIEKVVNNPHLYFLNKIQKDTFLDYLNVFRQQPFTCNRQYHLYLYCFTILQTWLELGKLD